MSADLLSISTALVYEVSDFVVDMGCTLYEFHPSASTVTPGDNIQVRLIR